MQALSTAADTAFTIHAVFEAIQVGRERASLGDNFQKSFDNVKHVFTQSRLLALKAAKQIKEGPDQEEELGQIHGSDSLSALRTYSTFMNRMSNMCGQQADDALLNKEKLSEAKDFLKNRATDSEAFYVEMRNAVC